MAIVLTNALLLDLDPPGAESGEIRIEGGRIAARSKRVSRETTDEIVDCGGAVVLPGLVNGHTHLYSALAVGMPPPPQAPRNFLEILKFIWWRLDQALDAESIELSARIGALQALRCGTTTLIDHHASPNCIEGSLDLIEAGLESVGLRGVLCYETTDRHGRDGRRRSLAENERYLKKCAAARNGRFAALVGGHASFTLDDDSLDALADLAARHTGGVHIHVAEDMCDVDIARQRYGSGLIERLDRHGLLRPGSIFAHGTHLTPDEISRVNAVGATIAHNARSNMNNAVGYAPVATMRCPVMLGTDGIHQDMLSEARAAWLISRHQHAGLSPARVIEMLATAARRASAALSVTLGKLGVGAAADIVITDYVPFTPLTSDNVAGHLLFGLSPERVRSVLIGGQWRLRERVVVGRDDAQDHGQARPAAERLWSRMAAIPF